MAATGGPLAFSAPAKAVAFVLFVAAIAGATYALSGYLGVDATGRTVDVQAPRTLLNASAGHTVTFPVTVQNRGDAPVEFTLVASGLAESRAGPATAPPEGSVTLFLPVEVPAGTSEGTHALDVRIESGAGEALRTREGFLRVRVLPQGPGFADGDTAQVVYTGRIADTGRVFNTNDPLLANGEFARTDTFRASPGLLPVESRPRPSVVEGFYEGVQGMQPGESRTFTFPPEKGYGNATTEESVERDERLQRRFTLNKSVDFVTRDAFDDYVENTTGQGRAADYGEGDLFHFEQGANRWPYEIVSINATEVGYRIAAKEGERFTLYPFWPNASVVEVANEANVVFVTTPTTAQGETFTMKQYWPNMTALKEVTDEEIVVRHSPPVGFTYRMPVQFSQPRQGTVSAVTDTDIVSVFPSSHPLAGKALTFDVYVAELVKGDSG